MAGLSTDMIDGTDRMKELRFQGYGTINPSRTLVQTSLANVGTYRIDRAELTGRQAGCTKLSFMTALHHRIITNTFEDFPVWFRCRLSHE